MRLLHFGSDGELLFSEFPGRNLPAYAILSHTWGADADEISFQDVISKRAKDKTGYRKIDFCKQRIEEAGLKYVWIDTCCINKQDAVELSESIICMFRWYAQAAMCFVYLADVEATLNDRDRWLPSFRQSRWFKRGWTLQELLAPRTVIFYSVNGVRLGDKRDLEQPICDITGIAKAALLGRDLSTFTVEERFAWAARRETKREEDEAYCLLGIFGVILTPRYGEERDNAIRRLRSKVTKASKRNPSDLDDLYDGTTLSDNHKRALIGPKPPSPAQYKRIVALFSFDEINDRYEDIKRADSDTCSWIFETPEYTQWQNPAFFQVHNGLLWVKGKPGSGKSTITKFIMNTMKSREEPDCRIIHFFFHARGTTLQKSTSGLYRSLLFQLLTRCEHSVRTQCRVEKFTLQTDQPDNWSIAALKDLFTRVVVDSLDKPLTIFVDALDECSEVEVRDMITVLECLSEHAAPPLREKLRIYFASRHYPHVSVDRSVQIILEYERGHFEDIRQYLTSNLRIGESQQAEVLRDEIGVRAEGVFMWVVLVSALLKTEVDRGRGDLRSLKRKLSELPTDLHDLFFDMLSRDNRNTEETKFCLLWVLCSTKPLGSWELYGACMFQFRPNAHQEFVESGKTGPQKSRELHLYLLDASKGLIETTHSFPPTVQFIHESVRDFLLRDGGLAKIWPEFSNNAVGRIHERLKHFCAKYVRYILHQSTAFSNENVANALLCYPFAAYAALNIFTHAEEAMRQGLSQDEFLIDMVLACRDDPHHVMAQLHKQGAKFENEFSYPLSPLVAKFENGFSYPLSPLVEFNLPGLIKRYLQWLRRSATIDQNYWVAFHASLSAKQDYASNALVFLDDPLHIHPEGQPCACSGEVEVLRNTETLLRGLRSLAPSDADNLRKSQLPTNFWDLFKKSSLGSLFDHGVVSLGMYFYASRAYHPVQIFEIRRLLHVAAYRGENAIIELLLKDGHGEERCGTDGTTANPDLGHIKGTFQLLDNANRLGRMREWMQFSRRGIFTGSSDLRSIALNDFTLELKTKTEHIGDSVLQRIRAQLLAAGVHIFEDCTALHAAVRGSKLDVVNMLLNAGYDVDNRSKFGPTPLQVAAFLGDNEMIRVLLKAGANVNATSTALRLERSEDPSTRNLEMNFEGVIGHDTLERASHRLGTALTAASGEGHRESVRILLAAGADVRDSSILGLSPIQAAIRHGHIELLHDLVHAALDGSTQPDNDTEMQDLYVCRQSPTIPGRSSDFSRPSPPRGTGFSTLGSSMGAPSMTPNHAMVCNETVQLLLAAVANKDLRIAEKPCGEVVDREVDSCLLWASSKEAPPLELRRNDAFCLAAAHGFEQVATLLLANGAEIDHSKYENSALAMAAENGHYHMVSVLIDMGAAVNVPYQVYSPLARAAQNGHTDIVRLLLKNGAIIEGGGHDSSALPRAVEHGHLEIVELLIQRGASVMELTYRWPGNKTVIDALAIAQEEGFADIVDIVQAARREPGYPLIR